MITKNYGVDIAKELAGRSESDWKFGGASPVCIAEIAEGERQLSLPKGEVQFGREDFMDCATRGPMNILECKLNWLLKNKKLPYEIWFRDNGYITENGFELSDRFTAILSNTTRYGNSLKAPLDSLRKNGVIPKRLLPKGEWMTFDDYIDGKAVTGSMLALGQNFLRHMSVNYEIVNQPFEEFLKRDMIDVAGFAWPAPINGEYPKIEGQINHVWVNFKNKYFAFDNYIDSVDGDYIKKLSPDYIFYDYGYRIILSVPEPEKTWSETFLEILKKMAQVLGLMKKQVEILQEKSIVNPIVNKTEVINNLVEPKKDIINEFCLAIRDEEGNPGDLNYRNNNPGNIRGKDGKFLVFKTYELGFAYLKDYVKRACTGKHSAYLPTYTFYQFFAVYAPKGDKNDPKRYAEKVCQKIGLKPTDQIKILL